MKNKSYYITYKPYNVINQFTGEEGQITLASLFDFPKDVYPVGRLDLDSEGLLLLTNDTTINNRLLNPKFKHEKEYWIQVDGEINEEALAKLRKGVKIRIDKKELTTRPAKAEKLTETPDLPERNPPIRFRANIPTSWISLTITEGKKHQVRKMTAAVGFPTLRLVRVRMQGLYLENMQIGEVRELEESEVFEKLFGQ
ncbi:MAG: pseudouridine synthase [Cytophagales bacterium]|nr:MAG: pseudouridine synthase [Cytophagales bacterium]TAH28725.1 MAG: pseudouridine synthase [Cytophagales bacterium]